MKHLIVATMILIIAGGAVAEDTFGLWRQVGDDYVNYIPSQEATTPFTLYIGLHDPSVFSVGGYEVGIDLPPVVLILNAIGPNDWTNFGGDASNHLVGYTTPLPATGDPFTILGELQCLSLESQLDAAIIFHGANPPSIPGHDGPVIADGVNPDDLIACGFVGGTPEVFRIFAPDPVRSETLSDVKALFD